MTKDNSLEKITLSHKIVIQPVDDQWKDVKMIFRDLQYEIQRVLNGSVFVYWSYDSKEQLATDMRDEKITISDIDKSAPTLATYINRMNKSKYLNSNGEVLEQAAIEAKQKYKYNKKKMVKGEGFIPSFGSNPPIPMKNSAFKITKEKGQYYLTARMLSKEYAENLHNGLSYKYTKEKKSNVIKYGRTVNDIKMRFKLIVKPHDKRTRDILDKCMSGEYKQAGSKFLKKVKGEWVFSLGYNFVPEKVKSLDLNKIMGIDMGIVYPVYMAFNDSPKRFSIEGGEITQFRKGIQARRNAYLKQGKYCGEGRRGHGRKTALKPIEKLQNRVEDFKNTANHKYSKYVVDMAIKHNCGVIQMEDLSGIADGEKKATFLGDWTYYDLQQKITYKAEKAGIKVVKINPNYTSQRCSKCGCISKSNRDAKVDQAKFECVTCGYKTNADYNAAKNIATEGIEDIIKEQKKAQEKYSKHTLKYSV